MYLNVQPKDPPPSCYGKSWDPKDTLCAGGADPAHRNADGSHVRPPCDFYNSCGSKIGAARLEQQQHLLAPSQLMRPQLPSTPVTPQMPTQAMTPQQYQQQVQAHAQQLAQQMMAHQQQTARFAPWSAPQAAPGGYQPPMGYQQMMPVNYQMPAYLTTPEASPDGSPWGVLWRSMFRSVGKSLGHTVSNFFDVTPLWRPPTGQ